MTAKKCCPSLAEEHGGIEQVTQPDDADIILFNTCSVREKKHKRKSSPDLGRVRPLKEKNPNVIIGVAGCVALARRRKHRQTRSVCGRGFGPQTLHRLPKLIVDKETTGLSQIDISFPEIEKFDYLPPARVEGGSAFISIMEGCSKYCSYCVVPYTRGEEFSPSAQRRVDRDCRFGNKALKKSTLRPKRQCLSRRNGKRRNLRLCHLCCASSTKSRASNACALPPAIRANSPTRLSSATATCPLVSHLHLPIQSGSDRVLSAMKRGYTALEYKSIIRKLRAIRPDLCLSSDFIVGFPGETEREFEQTLKLVKDIAFDLSFVFIYSPRPGTPAANLARRHAARKKSTPPRSFERSHRSRNRAHQPNHDRNDSTLLG